MLSDVMAYQVTLYCLSIPSHGCRQVALCMHCMHCQNAVVSSANKVSSVFPAVTELDRTHTSIFCVIKKKQKLERDANKFSDKLFQTVKC